MKSQIQGVELSTKNTDLDSVFSLPPHFFPESDYSAENADQDVRVHTPLMSLVDDED